MRYLSQLIMAVTLIAGCSFGKTSRADLALGFSVDGGVSFTDSFNVRVGDSLLIGIYIQQSGTDSVLTDEGIVSWGFDLSRSPLSFGSISELRPHSAFDVENHNVTTADGFEWEFGQSNSSGVSGNSILLGDFRFEATNPGLSTFTVEDRVVGAGIGSASWLTPSFNVLDEEIFGSGATDSFQFSILTTTAVPEPSSAIFSSIIFGMVALRRRKI